MALDSQTRSYVINRLKEPSTWRGLIMLLTAGGIVLSPGQVAMIVAAGTAAAGFVGTLFPDTPSGERSK